MFEFFLTKWKIFFVLYYTFTIFVSRNKQKVKVRDKKFLKTFASCKKIQEKKYLKRLSEHRI